MRGLLSAVDNTQGEGYSRYRWYPPQSEEQMLEKLTFVKKFEPYGWVMGAGDYLAHIEGDLKNRR